MTQALGFVLDALFHLFILAALIRFWMQAFRAPARNPFAQFSMAFTDFAVRPLRRVTSNAPKFRSRTERPSWRVVFMVWKMTSTISAASPLVRAPWRR